MSELDEANVWVPLHAALAWVATRDSQVFQRAIDSSGGNFYDSDAWDEEDRALAITKAKERDAWVALRNAIAAEKVEAQGFPYQEKIAAAPTPRPITHISIRNAPVATRAVTPPVAPSKWTIEDGEEEEEEDEESTPVPMNSPLPATGVNKLVLGGTGRLRPADWAIMGGQGWHSVVISRVDLATAFPVDAISDDENDEENESDEDEGQDVVPSVVSKKLDWKNRLVREVIKERWPKGMPEMTPENKTTLIQRLAREKQQAKAEQEGLGPEAIARAGEMVIGYSTITKAERLIKEGK